MRVLFAAILLGLVLLSSAEDFADSDEFDDVEEVDEELTIEEVPVKKVPEFDEDEFETLTWTPPEDTKSPKTEAKTQPAYVASKDPLTLVTTYWMECCFISFLLCYAINFWFGQKSNENLVTDWGVNFQKLFLQNFAKVGGEAFITKTSQNTYKTSASGRINCIGLEATLDLVSRTDLVSILSGLVFTPGKDTITIDVAMEPSMAMAIFAIVNRSSERELVKKEDIKDIPTFAKKRTVEHYKQWNTDLIVFSDSVELVPAFLPEDIAEVLSKYANYIELIHFTDQSLISNSFKKTLRFVFRLPPVGKMSNIQGLMEVVPVFIDLVATTKLSAMAEKKALKVRQDFAKEAKKEKKDDLQEERDKRLEEKYRREKERFDKMSYEEQQKELAKRKKREEKRRMKSGKVKVMF